MFSTTVAVASTEPWAGSVVVATNVKIAPVLPRAQKLDGTIVLNERLSPGLSVTAPALQLAAWQVTSEPSGPTA